MGIQLKFSDTGYICLKFMLRLALKAANVVFEGYGSCYPKYGEFLTIELQCAIWFFILNYVSAYLTMF